MANPRQRRKLKSGSSSGSSARAKRVQQKRLVRVPTIKGAKVIQDAWDPKLTVRQNYEKLGLVGNLSMRDSGGKEREHAVQGTRLPEAPKKKRQGMATIQRDADGNVVSVEIDETSREETAWGPALNSDDEEVDDEEDANDVEEIERQTGRDTEVTQSLEELSKTIKPVERFTSQAEKSWLHRLVAKHGTDVGAMSRDRIDNVWQRTEGELKRAIKKAGGFEALQE